MQKSGIVVLALIGLAAATMLLRDSLAQPAPATRPAACPVAVCDVVEVFNNYQRAKDSTAKLNERREAVNAENKKRGEAIEAMKMELDALKAGSREYEQRFNEMQRLTIDRQAWLQYQDALAMRDHYRLTREMYEQILKMVSAVAGEHGYKVVIQRDKDSLESQNTQELIQKIAMRKVLFSDEGVDITDTVLTRLNEAYRAAPNP